MPKGKPKIKKAKLICKNCGKVLEIYPCYANRKFCSKECYRESLKGRWVGEKNPNFKNRSWYWHHQYKMVWVGHSYPGADKKGRIFEHRKIMQEYLWEKGLLKNGERLDPKIRVHHINGVKSDNRIENLAIKLPKEHNKLNEHYLDINYQGLNFKIPKEIIYEAIKREFR